MVIFLGGCMTVRTYTVDKPRTDRDVSGNQGFVSGEAPSDIPDKKSNLSDTRKVSVIEFEFGNKKSDTQEVEDVQMLEDSYIEEDMDSTHTEEIDQEDIYVEEIDLGGEFKRYIVKKNDTLQKISSEFYGTTRKWKKIYDANKNVLKSPDQVYPGTTIIIP